MKLRLHHTFQVSEMVTIVHTSFVFAFLLFAGTYAERTFIESTELPQPINESKIYFVRREQQLDDQEARAKRKNITAAPARSKNRKKNSPLNEAIRAASLQGFNAMIDLYERKEPEILRKGQDIKPPCQLL